MCGHWITCLCLYVGLVCNVWSLGDLPMCVCVRSAMCGHWITCLCLYVGLVCNVWSLDNLPMFVCGFGLQCVVIG